LDLISKSYFANSASDDKIQLAYVYGIETYCFVTANQLWTAAESQSIVVIVPHFMFEMNLLLVVDLYLCEIGKFQHTDVYIQISLKNGFAGFP